MLARILALIESSAGSLTVRDIARAVDAPVSAVEPMVETLVRTGMLTAPPEATGASCSGSCGGTCSPAECPWVVSLPAPLSIASRPRRGMGGPH